jgi:hypothetical protein
VITTGRLAPPSHPLGLVQAFDVVHEPPAFANSPQQMRNNRFAICFLITDVRIDRVFLFAGLYYGIQGMNVGGTRLLRIAPHLAYGEQGVQDVIPPNAVLTAELSVIAERTAE